MDSKNLTRMMIETAVVRGIEDMSDDPKRALRRLADMGRQFSTGRFQPRIIEIIQGLLQNEESPYYQLISDCLKTTDHEALRRFGINIGYNCWTYSARIIRQESARRGHCIPWILFFEYSPELSADPQNNENVLTIDDIREIIKQALPLGINAFCIMQRGGGLADKRMLELFAEYPDSAFFCLLEGASLSAAQMTRFSAAGNALLCINADAEDAMDTCQALKDAKALYSVYHSYGDDEIAHMEDHEYMAHFMEYGASMVYFLQGSENGGNAGRIIKDMRLKQLYPCFVWDIVADERAISSIICGGDTFFMVRKDGRVVAQRSRGQYNILEQGRDLEEILALTMPETDMSDDDEIPGGEEEPKDTGEISA